VQANANIVLHVPSGVTAARMARASDTLAGAGYPPDRTLRIDLVIGASNVRYYFPADAALARRIGRQLGATVRDFTNYRPRPSEGLIEVWLEGRPAAVPLQRDARLPPLVTGIARALSEALNGPPGTAGR